MTKILFIPLAAAALSFTACNSGETKTETMDTMQTEEMRNEAEQMVQDTSMGTTTDTQMMDHPMDSAMMNRPDSQMHR